MSKRDIHIRLSADITKLMVEIDEKYKEFVCEDGTMIVKLDKALYGIVEAPKLWYDTFCSFLQVEGFQRSDLDPCYFFKRLDNGEMIDITVHVDDGLLTCKNEKAMDELIEKIEKRFKIVKVVKGNTHFHLGMQIVFRDGKVDLSMASMASKIVEVSAKQVLSQTTPRLAHLSFVSATLIAIFVSMGKSVRSYTEESAKTVPRSR